MNLKMKRNKIAYKKISVCLIFFLGLLLCHSCSKDNPNLNIIRVQIETLNSATLL